MEIRFSRSWALALAAVTLSAATAGAQVRSDTRVPVRKDAPARVDTVFQWRTDTVYRTVRDTVRLTRWDTVTRTTTVPMTFTRRGGMYFGLGAGGNLPVGHLDNAQTGGPLLQAHLGWDQINGPFGLRVDATANQFTTNDIAYANAGFTRQGTPFLVTLGGTAKLNLPINPTLWNNFKLYGLGGVTYNYYRNVAMVVPGANLYQTDWSDKFGWQAGGGISTGVGNADLFIESRYVRFKASENANHDVAYIPISVGFNF
jgi:opacity protein-like surface antigen